MPKFTGEDSRDGDWFVPSLICVYRIYGACWWGVRGIVSWLARSRRPVWYAVLQRLHRLERDFVFVIVGRYDDDSG